MSVADQLFLSYRLRGAGAPNIVRSWEKLVRTFPYSRLARGASTLRIQAVSNLEPPLFETSFDPPVEPETVISTAREYAAADAGIAFDTWWDLWQFDKDWQLAPARVSLMCFGPEFESDREDDLRIEFGIDTHFLPQTDLPNYLFMARSNIRSLLHLVHELDSNFSVESRRLWTESGENFAQRLQTALMDEDSEETVQ